MCIVYTFSDNHYNMYKTSLKNNINILNWKIMKQLKMVL